MSVSFRRVEPGTAMVDAVGKSKSAKMFGSKMPPSHLHEEPDANVDMSM